MKKFLVSILMIFYLTSSIGASIHFHYCSDKLINWDVGQTQKDKCVKCGTDKSAILQKKGCCSEEYKMLSNGDQRITETNINSIHLFHPSFLSNTEFQILHFSSKNSENIFSTPLLRSQVPLYLYNCVFLI